MGHAWIVRGLAVLLTAGALLTTGQRAYSSSSPVAWLSGSWKCSTTGLLPGHKGTSSVSVVYVADSKTGGLREKGTSADNSFQGSIAFAGGRWVENVTMSGAKGTATQSLAGEDVDVSEGHIDLTGTQAVGSGQVQVRSDRRQTGKDTYTETGLVYLNNDWTKVEQTECKRQ